jgi:hypothetical protein
MPKLCDFETCRNRATYGLNCNPLRCFEHKEINMKLSSTLCFCGKKATFNYKDLKPKYCSNCREIGMIDIYNKSCCFENCSTQANFNYENEKNPIYCSIHKIDGMINIKNINLLCVFENCTKRANYNTKNSKKPLYCSNHKKDDMINVTHPICKFENCFLIPSYNYENERNGIYCLNHKLENMINVVSKTCLEPNCNKRPSFNYSNEKNPIYCSEHYKNSMINVVSNKCIFENCKTIANFNYENKKRGIYCEKHKLENMIDVHHQKCKAENCQTRGNKNYKGYCANCFQYLFPNDPLTFQIRSKTKEIAVRDFINSRFEGFQHDKPLWYNESACDCTTKRRIDHRKLINETLLCIETDENQHKYYSKEDEIARYNELFMAYGGKFIFIRFNPDKYVENGKSKNPMLVNRLPVLESEINKQIKRIENSENTELLEVIELYYDKSI